MNPCLIELSINIPDIVRDVSDVAETVVSDPLVSTVEACPSQSWLVSPRLLVTQIVEDSSGTQV